jgi:hypothetical protein
MIDSQDKKDYELIKKDINKTKLLLAQKIGIRDQLKETLEEQTERLQYLNKMTAISEKVHLFLMSEIAENREVGLKMIEDTATYALQSVYGSDYYFKFQSLEDRSQFKITMQVGSSFNGKIVWTGLIDSIGGGGVEVIAFALKIAALNWKNYSGPLLLDETYKSMSKDEKIDNLVDFLDQVSSETKRQIIFATHDVGAFAPIAKTIIETRLSNKKVTKVRKIK